jgi:hypothetical protein
MLLYGQMLSRPGRRTVRVAVFLAALLLVARLAMDSSGRGEELPWSTAHDVFNEHDARGAHLASRVTGRGDEAAEKDGGGAGSRSHTPGIHPRPPLPRPPPPPHGPRSKVAFPL